MHPHTCERRPKFITNKVKKMPKKISLIEIVLCSRPRALTTDSDSDTPNEQRIRRSDAAVPRPLHLLWA